MDIRLPARPGYEKFRDVFEIRLRRVGGKRLPDSLFLLPDLTVTLLRILTDPATPAGRRFLAAGGGGYLVTPSTLPGRRRWLTVVDDLMVLLLAVRQMLVSTDPERLRIHWPSGDLVFLEKVTDFLQALESRYPERIHDRWLAVRPF